MIFLVCNLPFCHFHKKKFGPLRPEQYTVIVTLNLVKVKNNNSRFWVEVEVLKVSLPIVLDYVKPKCWETTATGGNIEGGILLVDNRGNFQEKKHTMTRKFWMLYIKLWKCKCSLLNITVCCKKSNYLIISRLYTAILCFKPNGKLNI